MSLDVLLLACLCGAVASGAPTSLRDLSKSELDDYCQRHRGDGDAQLLGGEPTSTDDDGFTASQCWSQMIACVDVEYATPEFSVRDSARGARCDERGVYLLSSGPPAR